MKMKKPNIITDLPREVSVSIMKQLSRDDMLNLRLVSKSIKDCMDENYFVVPLEIMENSSPLQIAGMLLSGYGSIYIKCHSILSFIGDIDVTGIDLCESDGCRKTYTIQNSAIINDIDRETGVMGGFVQRPVFDTSQRRHPWYYDTITDRETIPQKVEWIRMKMLPDYKKPIAFYDFNGDFALQKIPKIYRAGWDKIHTFGDGGMCRHVFPVWVCNELPVSRKMRKQLLEQLLARSDKMRDIQPNGIVHDILSPDLYTNPIPNGSYRSRRLAEVAFKESIGIFDYFRQRNVSTTVESEIREKYHWVPVDININENGNAQFVSSISGIGPDEWELSRNLERLFEKMIPMFQRLDQFIPIGKSCRRQTAICIQSYTIPPGMSYSGHWHVEGMTENIMAVGVYYVDVSSQLEGGELKFRCSSTPDPLCYQDSVTRKTGVDPAPEVEIPIKTGKALVFSNQIPHRFKKIINRTDQPLRRVFINFFMVDPLRPLPSTNVLPLATWESIPIEERKKTRQRVRDYLSQKQTGWAVFHWGNFGTVEYIEDSHTWEWRSRSEIEEVLRRTNSDSDMEHLFD